MERQISLGLIGYPLGHSRSPEYFRDKFRLLGIDGSYELFPLDNLEKLPGLLEAHPELKGLNVTVPYKEEVMQFCDELSVAAMQIGAVNTLKISRTDGRLTIKGFNTDHIGFSESIIPIIAGQQEPRALVLGTGGASKAVTYTLRTLGIPFLLVSRTPERKNLYAGHDVMTIGYHDITKEIMQGSNSIVNCTPLGMWPHTDACPDIPWHWLEAGSVCYDLVYNPGLTEFMCRGAERGASVKNGLEMLMRQADAAWDIWTERR